MDRKHWTPVTRTSTDVGLPRKFASQSSRWGAPASLISANGYLTAPIGPSRARAPAALGPPEHPPLGRGQAAYHHMVPHLEGGAAPLLAMTSANPAVPPQAYNFYTVPLEVPTYVPLPAVRSQAFHMPQPLDDEGMAELMQHIDAFDLETANCEQVSRNLHMDVHNYLESQPK